jgi:prepilin-type N-terminal cleavage/methylation domain-containing protein
MAMNRACGNDRRRAPSLRAVAGFSLVEIVVSTAVMAVLATALGALLSTTTYQSARAIIDQRVNMLVNREVNFFRSVPYSELTNSGLTDESGTGPMSWQQQASSDPQAQVYVSTEGADGNSYLLTIVDQTGTTNYEMCRYHFLITRTLTINNDDPNNPYKMVDLSLDWWGPNPNYQTYMYQTQHPVDASADWQNDPNAVHQNIKVNTIYRYP